MRSSIVMKFADGWHIERRESWGGVSSYLVKGDIETKITPEEERRICATRPRRGTETIVAAAIRVTLENPVENSSLTHYIIMHPPPARHADLLLSWSKTSKKVIPPEDQGFLTSNWRFVEREEALQLALDACQEFIEPPYNSQLFSENLW